MAFSRTGSTDCMIPSLLSISLICGCIPSMAFIFLATSTSGCPTSSLLRILAVRALDVLDGGGLGNGGVGITSGLGSLGGVEGGLELSEEVILSHEVVGVGGDGGNEGGGGEFHL